MLDHVERHGEVEAVVGEGHPEHRSFDNLARAARARQAHAGLRELDAGHRAVAGELDHVAPAAAPGVEDARAVGHGQV